MQRKIRSQVALATLTALMATITVAALSARVARGGGHAVAPAPAGEYSCLTSALSYSALSGPGGPMLQIQYNPSALGTLRLDGKGGYRTRKSAGRYTLDAASGRFRFASGTLKGWSARFEVVRGTPTLRLAPRMGDSVGDKTRTGEHVCRWRGAKGTDAGGRRVH